MIDVSSASVLLVLAAASSQTDRGTEVLQKFLAAAGIERVEAFSTESERTLQTPQGVLTASVRVDFAAPDRFRETSKMPFGEIVTVIHGEDGWASTPRGVRELSADQRKRTMEALYRSYLGFLWAVASGGAEAVYEQEAEIRGERALEMMIRVDGFEMRGFFDDASGRLQALVLPGTDLRGTPVTEQRLFEAFESTGGVTLPTKVSILHNGEVAASVSIASWSVNESPRPELFERPDGARPPDERSEYVE